MCENCVAEMINRPVLPAAVYDLAEELETMAAELRKLPVDSAVQQIAAMEAASTTCFYLTMIGKINGPRFNHEAEQRRERIARSN